MADTRSTQIAGLLEDADKLRAALEDDVPESDNANRTRLMWLDIRVAQALLLARELEETL